MLFCIITPKDVCFHFWFLIWAPYIGFFSIYFHLVTAGNSRITVSRRFLSGDRFAGWKEGEAIYTSPQASENISCHCFCLCRWRGMSNMRIQNCFMSNANFLRIPASRISSLVLNDILSCQDVDEMVVELSWEKKAAKSTTKFQEAWYHWTFLRRPQVFQSSLSGFKTDIFD